MSGSRLQPEQFDWLEVAGGTEGSYPIHHWLSIVGYDCGSGALDMLIRFDDRGGHCHAHRHLTTTSVLVLEGEQHLDDLLPDGRRVHKVRRAGEHHLTTGDPYPHLERGGAEGALVFYSHHSPDGRLYEIVDDECRPLHVVTVGSLVETWENR